MIINPSVGEDGPLYLKYLIHAYESLSVEGFLKIDTLCFELSHSLESSLRSLSTM